MATVRMRVLDRRSERAARFHRGWLPVLYETFRTLTQPDRKEGLPKLDGLAVGNKALDDLAGGVGFDLVHQLHGFDDADNLPLST